ncbi:MAG: hypothetical protein LBG92_00890 [Prevotellaceae bacterium]|nr:hypothetical protein [Prevotellaceae bacterium]
MKKYLRYALASFIWLAAITGTQAQSMQVFTQQTVGDIRDGSEKAAFTVDYTINPDMKALPVKADGTKDEIAESKNYTLTKGENGKYTFILIDAQGNEHKVELENMPATIEDKSGNIYEINETGEIKPADSSNNTQESKTQIANNDISLYIAVEERNISTNSKGKTENKKYDRYYENGETIILPAGNYKFTAYRNYVEVKETDNLTYKDTEMDVLPVMIKDIKDLSLLSRTPDKTAYTKETGENSQQFKTLPYLWEINSTVHDGKNDIEQTFDHAGNYSISVKTRTAPFQRAKTVSQATAGTNAKVEHDGWIQVLGISDFKLNIMVLDPEPVYFTRGDNYAGEYGFDNYEKTELRTSYKDLQIEKADKEKIQYAIPYMSLSNDNPHVIMAGVMITKNYLDAVEALEKTAKKEKKDKPAAYTFITTNGLSVNGNQNYNIYRENLQKDKNNKISLQISRTGTKPYNTPDTLTVKDITGKIVGKMIVLCAIVDKSEKINLVKVYLGDSRKLNNLKSAEILLNEAITFMNNRAYNQLFAEFSGSEKEELVISDAEIESTYKNYGEINSVLNDLGEIKSQKGMTAIDAKIQEKGINKWTGKTIIVIANRNHEKEGNHRTQGFNNGIYSIIYNSAILDYTTYVHELGHAFGLEHPFPETDKDGTPKTHLMPDIQQGTSRNFMDYAPVTDMFWKWQWDDLRKEIGKEGDDNEQNQQKK